jgi:hypothetical protein
VIDDSAQTPNTQLNIFDYEGIPVFQEIRGLPTAPGREAMDHVRGLRAGVLVQCEGGYYTGRNGGWVYDNRGKRIRGFPGDGGDGHLANFIAAMHSRRSGDLAASLQSGYTSSSPVILSTIAYRVGRPASPAAIRAELEAFPAALERFASIEKHLGGYGVDLESDPMTLGRWLEIEPADGTIRSVSGGDPADEARAHHLFRGVHRPGYDLPETV